MSNPGSNQGNSLFQKACLILITGLFLFRAPAYAPDTEFIVGGFSSDTSIPVLIANSDEWSPFSLYYWGQDRFGSWPFLLYRWGEHWTPIAIFLGMYIYLHAGLLVFMRNKSPVLLTVSLLILHLLRPLSGFIFDIAQPYGWQLGSILIALAFAESKSSSKIQIRILLFFFSFLSIWLSPSSVLFLSIFPVLQSALLSRTWGFRIVHAIKSASPVVLAYAAHSIMRRFVVGYNAETFYEEYETPLKWKSELVAPAWNAIRKQVFSEWELALWVLATIVLFWAIISVFAGQKRWKWRSQLPALTFMAGSVLFLLSILPLNWFSLNQHGARYLALPRYLMLLGLALLLFQELKHHYARVLTHAIPNPLVSVSISLLAFVAILCFWPALADRSISEHYQYRKAIAKTLESKYPHLPLIGNYWETYVYSSLQSRPNIPQPGPGQYQRTPFLQSKVLGASSILINHQGFPMSVKEGRPIPEFRFQGQSYRLERENILSGDPAISLYIKLNR